MTVAPGLSHIEECFLVNAFEQDLLAGVFGDLTSAEQDLPLPELAAVLRSLVDRGWIEVRRCERWIAEDGQEGLAATGVVPEHDIARVLADPHNWEYPDDPSWIGAITLVETEAWVALRRRPREES
jgi:hypothetical protein